jgi:FkbM family methyltransferase
MSIMTAPAALWMRRQARQLGFSRVIGKFIQRKDYEAAYWRAMAGTIRPGDCVWDVGANIGHYTLRFADLVGNQGRVIAFEPSQDNFARLRAAVADRSTVALRLLGLSNEASEAWVRQGGDELGATSEIIKLRSHDSDHLQPVRVDSGDRLIGGDVLPPNIIKIDVEGHEWEVIEGLKATLHGPALRAVFIEVHFAILAAKGCSNAPYRIEQLLRGSGFDIRWTDPSHLHAFRSRPRSGGGLRSNRPGWCFLWRR